MPERVRKDDSTAQKQYTWDGIDVVVEKNLANMTTQRLIKGYTPIAGIGPYLLQDLSGTQLLPLKNQVGTTQRETDTTGAVKNYYEYDAWGQPLMVVEATGAGQQYRFTGKELDPDNILVNVNNRRYHFPFRTYLPFRGLFDQADPTLLRPRWRQKDLYRYVEARPTSLVDSYGLDINIKAFADTELLGPFKASEDCGCGSIEIQYALDADSSPYVNDGPAPDPNYVGVHVIFTWTPTGICPCCTKFAWKQQFKRIVLRGPTNPFSGFPSGPAVALTPTEVWEPDVLDPNPEGWYNPVQIPALRAGGQSQPQQRPSELDDYAGLAFNRLRALITPYNRDDFRAQIWCVYPGYTPDPAYEIEWGYSQTMHLSSRS